MKLHKGSAFCLFTHCYCRILGLEQCLTYSRLSINICQMSQQMTQIASRNRLTDLESELMVAGGRMGEGIVRKFRMDRYTLLCWKWITNKDILFSTGNSTQWRVAAWMGGKFGGEWMHVYVWLSSFAVLLKPSRHCYQLYPNTKEKTWKSKKVKWQKGIYWFPWVDRFSSIICPKPLLKLHDFKRLLYVSGTCQMLYTHLYSSPPSEVRERSATCPSPSAKKYTVQIWPRSTRF